MLWITGMQEDDIMEYGYDAEVVIEYGYDAGWCDGYSCDG